MCVLSAEYADRWAKSSLYYSAFCGFINIFIAIKMTIWNSTFKKKLKYLMTKRNIFSCWDQTHHLIRCKKHRSLVRSDRITSMLQGTNVGVCVCVLVAQSCPILCDPMDCSPPGSSVYGIIQARVLEWVAISFSGYLPNPGIKPGSPTLQSDCLPSESPGKPKGPTYLSSKFPPFVCLELQALNQDM